MAVNGKSGLALLLIAMGVVIGLNQLGLHLHVMGILVPLALIGFGYLGIRNGRKIGWVLFGFGGLILAIKLSGLIGILIAVAMIAYGVSILKQQRSHTYHG
ncbi:hypothetical protein B5M42_013915 [Paenibacillus athensensis]|uniref:LiaF transmembrane domain-containing protein n=1 Tax=Paenibacillus athensensis TaxID=1967502 RepID=A0A4Y8PZZ7_9BACL|nr:hypothetical protein [Paenibacillus athensensis]MCD1259928.1 hypothetical protein [Paenibacillus athensensis]